MTPSATASSSFPRKALVLVAIFTSLACLAWLARPAPATISSYSPAQSISAAGKDASVPQLAMDGSGRPTITWYRNDGSNFRVQAVRLAADGTPGTVHTLSAAGKDAYNSQVAVDSSGRATIVWQGDDATNSRIRSVRLEADGTPGAVKTLSPAGLNSYDPQIAIGNAGRATIVWQLYDGSFDRIQSVRLADDGTPGAIKTLSEAGQTASSAVPAIDDSDRTTVTWLRSDGSDNRVQSVRLEPDGTPGTVRNLSGAGEGAFSPRIVVDGSERATITWYRYEGAILRVQAVRLAADGTPGAVQTLSEAGQDARNPQLAVDASGRVVIAWRRTDGSDYRVQSVFIDADGTPGSVQTLSEPGEDAAGAQPAIDSRGRATIAWYRPDGTDNLIQAVRLAADGIPGEVRTLSDAGQDSYYPQLAVDASGQATVAWQGSDGTNTRIQVARAVILRPGTTIVSGPKGVIRSSSPRFRFSSETEGASFECSLDSKAFVPCVSRKAYRNLANGPHEFAVRAVDAEGDPDLTPDTRGFRVAAKARIGKVKVRGPGNLNKGEKASFRVRITNSGSATAKRVKLKVTGKGVRARVTVGRIAGGKTRSTKVAITPKRIGKARLRFKVSSGNAGGKSVVKKVAVG